MPSDATPEPIRSPLLDAAAGIRHGYFTRIGGVSAGLYDSLNIGTGSADDQALIRENRRRVAAWMGVAVDSLLTAYQVHSPDVIVAREPFSGDRPKADGIVTDRPGIAVGASSADCGPVLFADPKARIGAHRRRRACRLEGRLDRGSGKHDLGNGAPRLLARKHCRRTRPVDQREKL
jgi:polyphenol oxidase